MNNTENQFAFEILKGVVEKSTTEELVEFKELVMQSPDSELKFSKRSILSVVNEELTKRSNI
jgi:hypothetical protein